MELEVVAIKYVGPATVKRLAEHGITTVEQLAAMSVEALTALPGIGENTAPLIIANAQEILAEPIAAETVEAAEITEAVPAVAPEAELSAKVQKKLAKQAKKLKKAQKAEKKAARKAAKKAEKKAEKQLNAERKAAEKAEKKAAKQAKKAEKKVAKSNE